MYLSHAASPPYRDATVAKGASRHPVASARASQPAMSRLVDHRRDGKVPLDILTDRIIRPSPRSWTGPRMSLISDRGAQLVGHVGEELALVLGGNLQFPTLGLDLAEQAGVLDRQG